MDEQRERTLAVAQRAIFEAHRRERTSAWIRGAGGSMRPLIEPGDWLHVAFGDAPRRLGEILVYPAGDVLVAHRLVGRVRSQGRSLLVTKGDALPACDPPLAPGDVLGVVRVRRRAGGGRPTKFGCSGLSARVLALRSTLAQTSTEKGRG